MKTLYMKKNKFVFICGLCIIEDEKTTLKVAKQLGRNFIGYEISRHYEPIIEQKIGILC